MREDVINLNLREDVEGILREVNRGKYNSKCSEKNSYTGMIQKLLDDRR